MISESQTERDHRFDSLLCQAGGQAIFHPEWSPELVIHYVIAEHLDDGFYDHKVTLYAKSSGKEVASFHLLAALEFTEIPPFQCSWKGTKRACYCHPAWLLNMHRANPVGLELRTHQLRGALVVSHLTITTAEWDALPPHVVLVDPASIKLE